MLPLPSRANLLGVHVSVTDYTTVTRCVIEAAREQRPLLVAATDVHSVIQARSDPAYAAALNSFDIVAPDGQPVRWGLRLTGQAALRDRVYGPTLMLRVCEAAAREHLGVFLYGGRPQTLRALCARLVRSYPALHVAGTHAGRFRPLSRTEQADDAHEIEASGAAIVFVGMGCPRQEWWLHCMRERVRRPMLAVGAAFDIHAGVVPMAPPWMQARGLEWLFRLAHEPRRLGPRYLWLTPRYVPLVLAQAAGLRDFPAPSDLTLAADHECPG